MVDYIMASILMLFALMGALLVALGVYYLLHGTLLRIVEVTA